MFKCEVERIFHMSYLQETKVFYKLSSFGSSQPLNHILVGTNGNHKFTLNLIDKSIKVGDLLRCDGLPYMSRPRRIINTRYIKDSCGRLVKTKYIYGIPTGYTPFQLDSGYWVLRKNEHLKKKEKTTAK